MECGVWRCRCKWKLKASRLVHYSPEARSGIFAVQRHGKPLAEHDSAGAFSLELAYGQGRSLGKLRPNTPSDFAPASTNGFHDHRHERHALILAL